MPIYIDNTKETLSFSIDIYLYDHGHNERQCIKFMLYNGTNTD